jgi:hypothetical protein
MFDEMKAEWDRFFNFYKNRFNEEVEYMPEIFGDEHLEMDLVIGQDSGLVRGLRFIVILDSDEDDEDEEGEDDAEGGEEDEAEAEGDDEDVDLDDDSDDEDDEAVDVVGYDLAAQDGAVVTGQPLLELTFLKRGEGEDEENDEEPADLGEDEEFEGEYEMVLKVYTEDGTLDTEPTGAEVLLGDGSKIVWVPVDIDEE